MKISLSLTALALAVAAPVAYTADAPDAITFYGKVNASLESNKESKNNFKRQSDVVSNGSYAGIKGGAAINDNLTAVYTLEWALNTADDNANGGDKNISSRNQYVGLVGNFGELLIGRNDTMLKQSQGRVDLFNDLRGDITNLFAGDVRSGDSLTYKTPNFDGFQAGVSWITEGAGYKDENGETDDAFSIGAWYGDASLKQHHFYAALAYDNQVKGFDTLRATLYGKLGPLQLGAMYQQQEAVAHGADDNNGYLLNGAWNLDTAIKLLAQFQTMDEVGDSWSLGGEYLLAKPTKTYLYYTSRDLDAQAKKETYLGIGLEHKF